MIKNLQDARTELSKKIPVSGSESASSGTSGRSEEEIEQENKFNKDLLKMKEERLSLEMKQAQVHYDAQGKMIYEGEVINEEKKALLHQETLNKIKDIEKNYAPGLQQSQMIEQVNMQTNLKIKEMDDELKNIKIKNLDNYVEHATTASEASTRAWDVAYRKEKAMNEDKGKRAIQVQERVTKASMDAFHKIGAGQATLAQAAKQAVFTMAADEADAAGNLKGIAKHDPTEIAAGAGLMTLAGFLRSQAGGGGGSGSGDSGGGGGSYGGGNSSNAAPEVKETPKKAVSVTVQGSYFETEQTQRRLVELIRQESDATDFSFRNIGS
jgi:hypothetical protein